MSSIPCQDLDNYHLCRLSAVSDLAEMKGESIRGVDIRLRNFVKAICARFPSEGRNEGVTTRLYLQQLQDLLGYVALLGISSCVATMVVTELSVSLHGSTRNVDRRERKKTYFKSVLLYF